MTEIRSATEVDRTPSVRLNEKRLFIANAFNPLFPARRTTINYGRELTEWRDFESEVPNCGLRELSGNLRWSDATSRIQLALVV